MTKEKKFTFSVMDEHDLELQKNKKEWKEQMSELFDNIPDTLSENLEEDFNKLKKENDNADNM